MAEREPIYLIKAIESLEGAASENTNRRYQNSVNRAYYATFQAAVHALLAAGFIPPTDSMTWSHSTLQSLFSGELINRRKRYAPALRSTLQTTYLARQQADYSDDLISAVQAERALRRARTFVEAIQEGGAS